MAWKRNSHYVEKLTCLGRSQHKCDKHNIFHTNSIDLVSGILHTLLLLITAVKNENQVMNVE